VQEFARATRSTEMEKSRARFLASNRAMIFSTERGRALPLLSP
jgi:hypothetical protein